MMILLIGGSGCGKSYYAEKICEAAPAPRYYLAAMQPYGEEGKRRIERHRAQRAVKGCETIERYRDYDSLILPSRGTALLECIANLTANEMFDDEGNEHDPVEKVLSGIESLRKQCDTLVVITNDVGSDGIIYSPSTQDYIRAIGLINAKIASRADTVIEMVAGIPILLKGVLPL